jgi:1,4-alpha-glucan branching enzyme
MITKSYAKTGRSCRVTFKIPAEQADAQAAAVLGEFNGWNADTHPMERRKDGSFSATVTIDAGRPYRFRYLLDGQRWKNDEAADALVPNQFGTEDSLLSLDEATRTETVAETKTAKKAAASARSAKPEKAGKTTKAEAKSAPSPAKTAKAPKAKPAPRAGRKGEPQEH